VEVTFRARAVRAVAADNGVRALLAVIHDIGAVSRELKATLASERRGELFDGMRRDYEQRYARHELACYRVGFDSSVAPWLRSECARRLSGFGIEVSNDRPHYVLKAE
jgi:hypothetical protein